MRYAIALWFVLSCVAYTQNSTSKVSAAPGTLKQVLYVADATNLYTYDIDPQTYQPSLMGTIPLPKAQLNGLAVSSDGSFLYVMASDPYPASDNRVYVYDTNGYGVPGMPVQSIAATNDEGTAFVAPAYGSSMVVDPTGNFLYVVHYGKRANRNQNLPWSIYRYEINATNGELSQLVNAGTYRLPDQAGLNDCSLSILGMNAKGTDMYDYEFCGTREGTNGYYNEIAVNPQTGGLGALQQIFAYSVDSFPLPDSVQIVKGLVFAFEYPIPYQPYNELQVYPVTTGQDAKPLITCTSTMLAACGSDIGVAYTSGKYVFYTNPQDSTTEVDALDLSSKQIVSTGTSFSTPTNANNQSNILWFSPDGSVVYAWYQSTISIFGFNVLTAAITTGGSITDTSTVAILPAKRD